MHLNTREQIYTRLLSQSTPQYAVFAPHLVAGMRLRLSCQSRTMEVYTLTDDLKVFCVQAKSFPNDIGKTFGLLIQKLPTPEGRVFFGISEQAGNKTMVYKAAVLESYEGEGQHYGCETYTIKKGDYVSELLKEWKKDEASIGLTFRKMADARPDTVFPCVEWYQGEDVLCMVRILRLRSESSAARK